MPGPATYSSEPLFAREEIESAFQRVHENEGCAGADAVTVHQFSRDRDRQIERLQEQLATGTYRPYPLLKIVVQKKPGSDKTRTLLVPAVRDRVLQTAAARQLSRSFEEEFLECSFGYRPGRSVDRAIARIRKCHELGFTYLVDGDIHAFFDEVDHALLKRRLAERLSGARLLPLVERWIDAEIWDGDVVRPVGRGIPQGSPISPLLANFFLEEFDLRLEASGCKLVRYADDFVILARTREQAERGLAGSAQLLDQLHLSLATEKTRITSFDEGFNFLGAHFMGDSTWIPWKREKKMGRPLFVARPLPPAARAMYGRRPAPPPPPANWLRKLGHEAGRRGAAFAEAAKGEHASAAGGARSNRDMAFLYLTEQGAVLRKAGDRFLVEKEDEVLLDLPYHKLETIIVFGNIQVTTQALGEALEKGVAIHFLSRRGEYRGALFPPRGAQVTLRLKQFQSYSDEALALDFARAVVSAKITNGLSVLRRYRHQQGDPGPVDDEAAAAMEAMRGKLGSAASLSELEGFEGVAARNYFTAVMAFNKSELEWAGRRMHPSPDPLNALLSLTYTLLTQELTALTEAMGLEPFLGLLHRIDYNRPSLALDLVEPFRHPLADRFVLKMVNKGIFKATDFHQEPGREGVFLSQTGLQRYLAEYEKWMIGGDEAAPPGRTWRQALRGDVEGLRAALLEGVTFVPLLWEAD